MMREVTAASSAAAHGMAGSSDDLQGIPDV
jgi:hypothetical protein